jgi:hypothetical protein
MVFKKRKQKINFLFYFILFIIFIFICQLCINLIWGRRDRDRTVGGLPMQSVHINTKVVSLVYGV